MSGIAVTANDVAIIIKAASRARVTKLRFGDLELEFDTDDHPNKTKSIPTHKDVTGEDDGHGLGQNLLPSHDSGSDDQLFDSEYIDQLAIENPLAFEEYQLKLLAKQG